MLCGLSFAALQSRRSERERQEPLFNVDFALTKSTPIREKMSVDFRAEFFNILNHTNLDSPTRLAFTGDRTYNGNAGRVTQTVTKAREIQLGLKLTF